MKIRWERMSGLYLGIGIWRDEPLFLDESVYRKSSLTTYINIFLLFGFLEIRLGR